MTTDADKAPGGNERRPVGRPSVANERREQILSAAERSIIIHGLAATTLQRIADEAGVSRSNLAHFIGDRDQIIDAAFERCVTGFIETMQEALANVALEDRLDVFLEQALRASPDVARRGVLFNELFAAAGRDGHARTLLGPAIESVDEWLVGLVSDRYPHADPSQRQAAGVTLALILKEYDRTRAIGADTRGPDLEADVRAGIASVLAPLELRAADSQDN